MGSFPHPSPLPLGEGWGEGKVIFHDVTGHELHRMCVSAQNKYPDVETWLSLLDGREYEIIRIRYTEKIVSNVFTGYLWFYWKEEGK